MGAVLGGVLAFLLRTWLVKLCKVQLERLYTPLTQSLADADALDGLLPRQGRRPNSRKSARRSSPAGTKTSSAPRRTTARRLPPPRIAATNGCARSTRSTPTGWSRSRRPASARCASAIDAHERRDGRAQGDGRVRLPQARREVQGIQGTDPLRTRVGVECAGRALARRLEPGGRRAGRDQPRSRRLLPRLERRRLAVASASQARPARDPLRHGSPRAGLAARWRLEPRRLDGRRAHVVQLPGPLALSGERQPVDRNARRSTRRGARGASGVDVPAAGEPAAGPGSVHDHRPDRHRPQLRRVHAPGRLRRCARDRPRSGPTRARSRSGWPTWPFTWKP